MKRLKSMISSRAGAATAALALCLLFPAPAAAQTISVWVEPAETRVAPGEFCTLYVHVDDQVDSLSCAECCLGFDSTVVSFVSARQGQLYDEAPFPKFFDLDEPSADSVLATVCVLGYRSYIIAPGSIFEVRFEALSPGVTDVEIGRISVLDIDRVPLRRGSRAGWKDNRHDTDWRHGPAGGGGKAVQLSQPVQSGHDDSTRASRRKRGSTLYGYQDIRRVRQDRCAAFSAARLPPGAANFNGTV